MRLLLEQDLVTRAAVHRKCHLIAHGAGRKEEARLLAQEIGHHVLQEIDGRIFALLLVAHFGFRHSSSHRGSRTGNGVAEQVYAYHSIDSILRSARRSGTMVAAMQMHATRTPEATSPGITSPSRPPYRSIRK
jgi:hypothetical protein